MASYPLLSQAPTPVEVELGCDNICFLRSSEYGATLTLVVLAGMGGALGFEVDKSITPSSWRMGDIESEKSGEDWGSKWWSVMWTDRMADVEKV